MRGPSGRVLASKTGEGIGKEGRLLVLAEELPRGRGNRACGGGAIRSGGPLRVGGGSVDQKADGERELAWVLSMGSQGNGCRSSRPARGSARRDTGIGEGSG